MYLNALLVSMKREVWRWWLFQLLAESNPHHLITSSSSLVFKVPILVMHLFAPGLMQTDEGRRRVYAISRG